MYTTDIIAHIITGTYYSMMPMARVVYCSATGVSDVKSMVRSLPYLPPPPS